MIPSPDWIVGVSLENLCLANCSWVDSRLVIDKAFINVPTTICYKFFEPPYLGLLAPDPAIKK